MTRSLQVDPSIVRETLILRLSGSLDGSSSTEVSRALAEATASAAPRSLIVVDLRQVDMLSADGVRLLRIFVRASSARGLRCRLLTVPGSAVARTIDTADHDRELVRFDDLHRALTENDVPDVAASGEPPAVPRRNDLAVLLGDMARSFQREPNLQDTMDSIVAAALVTVPGAQHAGLLVVRGRRDIETAASSGALVDAADRAQFDTLEGPFLDAAYQTTTVRVSDMARERRWPAFAQRVHDLGLRSMLSLRLHVTGDKLGGLNLYSEYPDAFDDESEQVGMLFATHAAVAMADARREQDLQLAMSARDIIGQAKGILMERHKITSDEAFRLLVQTSQRANIKVVEVARYLTDVGELKISRKR